MDATDSFYEWINGKTMPGMRPSPKQCYEAGYNNALSGIPNPEAVREVLEAATAVRNDFNHVTLARLYDAVESLSAPFPGAQQK